MRLPIFSFDEPTKIICGQGALKQLGDEVKRLKGHSVMIVCDAGIVKAGIVDLALDVLKDLPGVQCVVYDKIIPNPLDTTMDEGFECAQANKVDTIIGIGGGSSLDSAKGIALLMTNGGKMREYLMDGKVVTKKIAPTICIPTTAGTGSEVTRTVVATDSISKFKDGFKYADTIVAESAILDPILMENLPAPILAACGMDALTHAIEGYITWKGNPMTDAFNFEAIRLIGENIRLAYAQPKNMEAKESLLLASAMTGVAFDQSGLGLAHCMGHPMGGLFDIPHGVACAMCLPVTMEHNVIAVPEKLKKIANVLGVDTEGMDAYSAARCAVDAVQDMLSDLNLPQTLGEVGIKEEDIPALAADAMKFPGMRGASPRGATQKEVEMLFSNLL